MAGIGSMRERVTIQQKTPSADGQGGRSQVWSTLATVWASVAAQSGGERIQAGAVAAVVAYLVDIWYRTDVTNGMRLSWTPYGGSARTLEIHAVRISGPDVLTLECGEVAA